MTHADISTPEDAAALAGRILAPRERPLVLVSTSAPGEFLFDVDQLRRELDGIADVVTIATGYPSKHLESILPPKTQVFNGAGRSYPPDFADDPVWTRSTLRFPEHSRTDDLVNDAMAQTGRRTVQSAPPREVRRATGIVQGFLGDDHSHALVRLDDGTVVTATGALLPPDIPLFAALIVGEPVTGILEGTELHPEPLDPDLDRFEDGCQTLALVVKVTDLRATVQLHPRVSAILRRRDVDSGEGPVGDVLAVGDVIRVRVHRAPGGPLALSRTEADADEPIVAPLPLVVGGAPWLSEDRPVQDARPAAVSAAPVPVASDAPAAPAPALPAPDAATRADVAAVAREVAALRADLLAVTNLVARGNGGGGSITDGPEIVRLRRENEMLRSQLADERAERAGLESRLSNAEQERRETGRALRDARRAAERSHVNTTADGIRYEIERTWGNRTAPGERERWPLRNYVLGPDFVDSLAGMDESQLAKSIRTCVDAITGRDREIPARELHRLRTGEGGGDAYVVRQDGARCMRSSVEQNVAGARRLHYWELPGGGVELSRIVHHDDTRP